jgi:hypothetical protein
MSVLMAQEMQAVSRALTSIVLRIESTSDRKRKHLMQTKMAACYSQALDNAEKAKQQASTAKAMHNSLKVELWTVEAKKWQFIADEVLRVLDLVEDGGPNSQG